MDFFIKWFTDLLLKHKASWKVVLPLDGHRIYCSSRLLLQSADENNVTIKRPPNLNTRTLQHLYKCFLWTFKADKIAQYRTARLFGFAGSKVASVGFDVSAFEWTGMHPFNRDTVPQYLFSISDTSKTITSMGTIPSNISRLCIFYFSNQLLKYIAYLSRTFIKYSK